MQKLWAEQALLPSGWAREVLVVVGEDGRIVDITKGAAPEGHRCSVLLPAPVNAHSHAFQRAMAGLTEARGQDPSDSFWTWRRLMYRFLDALEPDQVQAIAALVQMEMLEAGYATCVEFHYLHHTQSGTPYAHLAEMSERLMGATQDSGIGLTFLPVQYQYGGCTKQPLGPGQVRFGNDPDRFSHLVDQCGKALSDLPSDAQLGVAPHSLRAVATEDIQSAPLLARGGPVHMHLAEQTAEIDEVRAAYGADSVSWVLDTIEPNSQWCFIHVTHMSKPSVDALAATGAVTCICPITEASLGDGVFQGRRWLDANGGLAIGSDSNINISLREELCMFEYSQRLTERSRAVLATPQKSTGRRIFDEICKGGAQAAGRETGQIAKGFWGDLLSLDKTHIDLADLNGDTTLDAFIFSGANRCIEDVWSAGRHMVKEGRHVARDQILAQYKAAASTLRNAL